LEFCLGIAICTKQTTGLFIMLMTCFYKVLLIRNKENFKIFIKIFIKRFFGSLVAVAILFIYLYFNNAISDFVNYTIKGVATFSNHISYIYLYNLSLETKILCIAVPISFMVMLALTVLKYPKKYWQKQLFIVFAYSLASFIVTFPISDRIHFCIGIVPCLIAIAYILDLFFECFKNRFMTKLNNKYLLKNIVRIIVLIFLIFVVIIQINQPLKDLNDYLQNAKKYNSLNHFKYINVPSSLYQMVNITNKYLFKSKENGKKVYILDASASIYTIPIDQYNKDYDMFLKGNLGANGENGIIDRIKDEENALYLILKDNYSRNWQNPEKVRQHIKKNLLKIDGVGKFDVYSVK